VIEETIGLKLSKAPKVSLRAVPREQVPTKSVAAKKSPSKSPAAKPKEKPPTLPNIASYSLDPSDEDSSV
jgi:hypothetical protein